MVSGAGSGARIREWRKGSQVIMHKNYLHILEISVIKQKKKRGGVGVGKDLQEYIISSQIRGQ